jgi:hypothetical protein
MTSMIGKLVFVIAATGGLSLAAVSPQPVEAGVIHPSLRLAAESMDSDVVMQVRCDRRWSNLWSCNDNARAPDRRDVRVPDSYASHPCDHSYQTATDGSHCGNRAADSRRGGR